jgi:hypothetical protein
VRRALCLLLLVAACSHGSTKGRPSPTAQPSEDASPTATASPSPSATASPTRAAVIGPAGTKVPTGFRPQSATFISGRTGWVLGSSPCPGGKGSCDVIARTRDGGATWKAIPSPKTSPDHLAQIRFANEADGFVTGDQLWATHDGGATWKIVPGIGSVSELAASDGRVWIAKDGLLKSAPVRGGPFRDWMEGIWFTLHGSHIAYTVMHEEFRLRVDDEGVGTPCGDAGPVMGFGSSTHWFLVCEGDAGLGHEEKHAFESFDSGKSWKAAGDPPQLTGTDIYVTSDGTFVVDHQGIAVRRAGAWKTALMTDGGISEGGFESATLGYCIGGFGDGVDQTMKITHDAGRTWKTVTF